MALGTTYFQDHGPDIVWRFKNISRVILNSISSTRIVRSFLPCLVFMGLGLLGMPKMDPEQLVLRRNLDNVGPDKGDPSGLQELEEYREPFAENAGLA